MTKRDVMIHMLTSRLEMGGSLFDDEEEHEDGEGTDDSCGIDFAALMGEMPEPTEMLMEGKLVTNRTRVELMYEESELTGMEGSVTSIGFDRNNPTLISMMRTGPVRTAMTFEEGKRHYCVYNTPYSDFEVCVRGVCVENELLTKGLLKLDYLVEIHGAQAEHCRMTITVTPKASVEDIL
ncbi:MAG: DUF1934 domain-containing protein [Clostridia bacterium]|nr:DUF1934 domain-containing protein [Clostridia bacterium]